MVAVIDGFRWSLLPGDTNLAWQTVLLSCVVTAFSLWIGVRYFRKTEQSFADVI
jgi:lipopolysaccharide transport system permease protein